MVASARLKVFAGVTGLCNLRLWVTDRDNKDGRRLL